MDFSDGQLIYREQRLINLILIFGITRLMKIISDFLNALADLGQDVTEFKQEKAPNPKKCFFKLEFETFTLDLLPELKSLLQCRAAFEKREIVNLTGTDIPFISYLDLIQDKEVNPRAKDLIDLEELRNRKKKH